METRLISCFKKLPLWLWQADNITMKSFHFLLAPFLLSITLPVWAGALQNHAEIRAAVEAFVRAQTSTLSGQVAVKVDEIDRRIALPACQKLEAFLPPGGQLLGNSTVGVRCPTGKKGWKLFLPVHVTVTVDRLIASKPLQQGQALHAEDIISQSGELAQTGILTDPALVVGKIIKYNIAAGQVLKQDMLRTPYAIKQGQTVQIWAEGAGFRIRSEGRALNNAAEGQLVRVRTTSDQVISGTARSGGVVEMRP